MAYLAIYGALVLFGAISSRQKAFRQFLFVVFSLLLFAFVAFRYEVGCDWNGYLRNYNETWNFDTAEALSRTEPAYFLLLVYLHSSALEYPYLNLLMAIPFFVGLVALARRPPDPLGFLILSFPVLIINMPMSAIRQAAAIGFVCLALVAFQERKLIRFVLMVAAGATFHTSAIVFLALAPFVKLPLTRTTIFAGAVLVLPGAYFMLGDTVEFYADRYVDTGIDAAGAIYRSDMLAAVGGYFLWSLRKTHERRFPADHAPAFLGAFIMLGTLAIVPISTVISDRFGYYVTPIQLIIMARMGYLVDGPQKQLIAAAPYLALGLVLVIWTTFSYHFQLCYVPYKSWLSWQ